MAFDGLGIDKDFLNTGMALNTGNLDGMQDMIDGMPNVASDSISEIFNSEMSHIIDFKVWTKVISLQKSFNDRVSPGWESDTHQEKYLTWTAILDETVEVIGSKKWKWWKDTQELNTIDWDNVQVELIDIFHFMLSISLQMKQQDSIFMMLMAYERNILDGNVPVVGVRDPKFFDDFWHEFIMAVWQKSIPLIIVKWIEFYYRSGGNYKTLIRDYFIKNSLNHIRQEFGYTSGKYQKMWRHPNDPSKLVEDNVVAGLLLKTNNITENLNEDSIKDMQEILRKYYLEFVTV